MDQYLNGEQIHILVNAYKKPGYVSATSLIKKPGVKAAAVEQLFVDGYLSKAKRQYASNSRTETALRDHGFEIENLEIEKKPPKKVKQSAEERLLNHVQDTESSISETVKSRADIQAILLKTATDEALAGDPWNFIRRQWPELVIRDEIDLEYFRRQCKRKIALDLRLDDAQVELIQHAFDPTLKEIAIKGSTSPGKGFATALLMNIWYSIYTNDRITVISQSSRHAKDVMFAEFVTWRKKMKHPDECETQVAGVIDHSNPKHFVNIANPAEGEGLSGGHGEHVLFVFDEATSVPSDLPINARKQASLIIYISNPRILSGFFYDLYPKVDPDKNQVWVDKGIRRACLTFGGHGALNVRAKRVHVPYGPTGGLSGETLDGVPFSIAEGDKIPERLLPHTRALIPGQMDWNKYFTIMQSPDPIERAWSGEGKFPPEDAEFQIIVPSWLKIPCAMWVKHHKEIEVTALGLDLAASVDGDETALVAGGPLGIKQIFRTRKANSMDTLSWIVSCCKEMGIDLKKGEVPVAIDAIGAGGAAMGDLMEQNGAVVYSMKGNTTAQNTSLYGNTRAELYGVLGERLNPDSSHLNPFMIPDDDKLKEELTAHEKHYAQDMTKFFATPKDKRPTGQFAKVQSIKERIGRSPDTSDAVVLCYWAIRDTEFDGSVMDQFNPHETLEAYREMPNGDVLEARADGNILDVTEEDFENSWGSNPATIEDEIEAMREAMRNVGRTGGGFGAYSG
jgi:hypothetical protein